MREIQFRGKPLKEQPEGWVYGHYVHFTDDHGKETSVIYSGWAEREVEDLFPDSCIVDDKTIGQKTGLNDCNGNPIWEGDILCDATQLRKEIHKNYCVVEWLDDGFACKEFGDPYSKLIGPLSEYTFYHVIGNIHDNPELLNTKA